MKTSNFLTPSPGNRKKLNIINCNICGSTFLHRDKQKHSCTEDAPYFLPNAKYPSLYAHGLFNKDVLVVSPINVDTPDQITKLNPWYRDHVILLHPDAMQQCNFDLGDVVTVYLENAVAEPAFVWPYLFQRNFSIYSLGITKLLKLSLKLLNNDFVCIRRADTTLATEITLHAMQHYFFKESSAFHQYCRSYLLQSVLLNEQLISVPFYGYSCEFVVSAKGNIEGQVEEVSHQLKLCQLQNSTEDQRGCELLRGECSFPVFYKFVESTKLILLGPSVENDRNFKSLAGLHRAKSALLGHIVYPLRLLKNGTIQADTLCTKSVLMYGPSGCGKTEIAIALAGEIDASLIIFDCDNPKQYVEQRNPVLYLLDNMERLSSNKKVESSCLNKVLNLIDQVNKGTSSTVLIGITSDIGHTDAQLRSRFHVEVEVSVPVAAERLEILQNLLAKFKHSLSCDDLAEIADITHGYTAADLLTLVREACGSAYIARPDQPSIDRQIMLLTVEKMTPSALKEISFDIPKVRWSDVGGQAELKEKLKQMVEWPTTHEVAFRRLGAKPAKGILMYGPPGCSKTMIAKALATECTFNFLPIRGPELFNKYVGESERAVRDLFRKARQVAPAIIFFDEIDALAAERETGSSGSNTVGNRVLTQLLTEMDGFESLNRVLIVAATNRPDRIDPALLRPGRLDRIVYVPLPDVTTRQDILQVRLRNTPLCEDVNLKELAEMTDGYSGAELVAVCDEAALQAIKEDINASVVRWDHFQIGLQMVPPRTDKKLLALYDRFGRLSQ
ncbi:Spermatogenesis-associated protein 5 [Trichinella pseudospiralis]|uniref:Spermatogenesis-associated protein 5 n=1 Tax=Trichinella pseudospiralis TaxID=6337 RepID=A0A0V1ERM4_TRIPS|nr:Spermatogenesis-associated protein 5 [Trichinella pseudospiralis]